MELSQLFTARSLAYRLSNEPSNNMPYLLQAWWPEEKLLGRDMKWLKSHKNLGIELAPSTEDTDPIIRPRGEVSMTKEEMPLFREQMKIDERDLYEIQRIQSAADPYAAQIINNIYNDAAVLREGARIAVERERSQLIAPINGNVGITIGMTDNALYRYNYDRDGSWKANHYISLSGTDTWDNPTTATPLNDLQEATNYLKSIGVNPRYMMCNSNTLNYLTQSEQIKNSLLTVTGKTVDFMTSANAQQVISQLIQVQPVIYDKSYLDRSGATQKFYPDDYVTIIGEGTLGSTYFGTTAEERTLIGHPTVEVAIVDKGVAIALVTEPGPPIVTKTTVSQIVLPSFEGMDSIFVIKVK